MDVLRNADGLPSKKPKIDSSELSVYHKVKDVSILNELKDKKSLFLHGKIGDQGDAVVLLEKKPFDTSKEGLDSLFSSETKLEQILANDIYSSYDVFPTSVHSSMKATMIFPATPKHIDKYRKQKINILEETGEDYQNITLPYLEKGNLFSVKWVGNILDKKTESERIIFEDSDPDVGFILLPDMKWDVNDLESMHLIALTQRRDLKSIRDLRKEHLPLLYNILKSGKKAVAEKYGVSESHMRIYLHYQPSYYHLHVHFNHIYFDAPGTSVTRAHLLVDVIENIEMNSDYYQKKTLTFVGKENDGLTLALQKK